VIEVQKRGDHVGKEEASFGTKEAIGKNKEAIVGKINKIVE
jgi:hypothetical protein